MSYYIKVYSHHGSVYDSVGDRLEYTAFNEYGPLDTWAEVEGRLKVLQGYDNIEVIDRD